MASFFGPISDDTVRKHATVLIGFLKSLTEEEFLALANKHGQASIKYMEEHPPNFFPSNDVVVYAGPNSPRDYMKLVK